MRLLSALALFVFLSTFASAADWFTVHRQGVVATDKQDYPAAAAFFRQSAPLAQSPVERGLTANDLGVILHQLKRDSEARTQLETAIRIWHAIPGQERRIAQSTEALATVCRTLGDYRAAEAVLREALKTPAGDDDNHSLVLTQLGDILREVGNPVEATQLLEQSLRLPGISVRRRLEATLALADLDRDGHRWQSAFDRWNNAAQIARENHWTALEASAVRGLGVTYLEHNEPARAEPLLRRALAQFEEAESPRHQIASTLSCLAQLYLAEKKFALAEDALRRGIDITEKSLAPNHPQTAVLLEMLGESVAARDQFDEARDYYSRARVIMAGRFGDRSNIAAAVDASWAMVEQRLKHNNEAAADYEKALAVLDAAGSEVESLRSEVRRRYADVCKTLHRKALPGLQSYKPQSFQATASEMRPAEPMKGPMSQSN